MGIPSTVLLTLPGILGPWSDCIARTANTMSREVTHYIVAQVPNTSTQPHVWNTATEVAILGECIGRNAEHRR
ncbi:MAG TPA: hypothetical protein VHA37_02775 [Candidatus Saccharimonadales bacterium]|nr:hypothetical protein [Candidatus Saccharimonadales bacterium]